MTIEQAALTVCRKADTSGRANFKEGAEWMLEKAINWLEANINEYAYECQTGKEGVMVELMLKDFKKRMEE